MIPDTRHHTYSPRVPHLQSIPCLLALLMLCPVNAPAVPNSFGMNVCPAADYDGMRIFADAMKLNRQWQEEPDIPIPVDEDGWPLQDGGTCVYHGAQSNGGTYGLFFTTQNPSVDARTVQVRSIWGAAQITNMRYDAATNTVAYDFVSPSPTQLKLGFSNTGGGVRDVRLMRPTTENGTTPYDTSVTFTEFGTDLLKAFQVVRFNAWLDCISTNKISEWADRTLPTYSTQTSRTFDGGPTGVAWEYIIQLTNEAEIDMYINLPLLVTDDYIRQLALLIRDNLDPDRKVYVEYSNEVWNFSDPWDAQRNHDLAVVEAAQPGSPLNYDGDANEWAVSARRVVTRSVAISQIFREVFGDVQMMTRIRPLLLGQTGGGFWEQGLQFLFDYYGSPDHVTEPHPPGYFFYGAGAAAYYRPDPAADIDAIWNSGNFATGAYTENLIAKNASLAAAFGLELCMYEGGPEMELGTTRFDAWDDPRMTDLIVRHHNTFSENGGGLFTYTEALHWGDVDDVTYSFVHNVEQTNTAKMAAIEQLAASERAALTFGTPVPAQFDGKAFAIPRVSWMPPGTGPENLQGGDWFIYVVRAEHAGTYGVTVETLSGMSGLEVCLDGSPIGATTIDGAGTTPMFTGELAPGLHGVLVKAVDAQVRIAQVNVTLEAISAVGNTLATLVGGARLTASMSGTRLTVSLSASEPGPVSIRLCTAQGRKVVSRNVPVTGGRTEVQLGVGHLSPGTYLVTAGGMVTRVLVPGR